MIRPSNVLESARAYVAAGLSILPIRTDGSKRPACDSWSQWEERIATSEEIDRHFCGHVGVGILGGKVSGNLETLDIDEAELVEPFEAMVRDAAPGLLERLPTVATPRETNGGRHYRYRIVGEISGNTKLAQSELRPQFNKDGTPQIDQRTGKQRLAPETLIETRGEGGYALAPGSPGECHETGLPYKHVGGPPLTQVPTITTDEHGILWDVARSLNRHVDDAEVHCEPTATKRQHGLSPGDDFNSRANWAQILEPAGWTKVGTRGDVTHWRRPGKNAGTSATTGLRSSSGTELFCVFSSNAHPFPGPNGRPCAAYSKFAAYSTLKHNGDMSAAAKELLAQGYGDRKPRTIRCNSAANMWQPFPVEVLPEPIGSYMASAAKAIGCDESYVALPLLAALASAIGNTRRVRIKSSWREPPVIWVAIIGESGTQKTPAYKAATAVLKRKQAEALAAHAKAMERFERDQLTYDGDLKAWHAKGRKAGEPPPEKPVEPQAQRYIVGDVTVEALADRLQHSPRGLLLVCDELSGWLQGFAQYKGGKGSDTGHWLSMFGAEMLLVDRKTGLQRTIFVPHAAVCVLGGIQPETLRGALGREHFANGLAARLLAAMPPRKPKRWTEATVDPKVEAAVGNVFDGLLALDFGRDDEDRLVPIDLPLTPSAKSIFIKFHDEHAQQQAELIGDLAAAFSKLECYAPRLALVLHCVRVAAGDGSIETPSAIDGVSMEAAVALVRWFAQEVQRVYGVLWETDEDRDQRQLFELVQRKGGRLTPRELMRASRRYPSAEAAEVALERLVKVGLGRWAICPTTERGGHPTRLFETADAADADTTPQNAPNGEVVSASALSPPPGPDVEEVVEWRA